MSKPWIKQYPSQVLESIDASGYRSIVAMMDEAITAHRDLPVVTSQGVPTTYGALDALSRRFAAWLQSEGVRKGDRIALMMPNMTPFAVAALGTLRAGAVLVAVNPLYTPRELSHQIRDSGARILVVFDAFLGTVAAALPEMQLGRIVVVSGGADKRPALEQAVGYDDVMAAAPVADAATVELDLSDLALLQYTGGTTGVSKGAMLTHGNIVSNVLQIESWLGPVLPRGECAGKNIGTFLPLYHIFALTICLFYGMRQGMNNHLVANARDLQGAIRGIGASPIHMLPGVNTLFAGLVQQPELLQGLNLTELRLCIGGGSAVQPGVAERWLRATGVPICEGYGLSETSSAASCNIVTEKAWTGTVGIPLPDTDFSIRDDDDREVATGERGEVCLRGPQVTIGYWQRPEETAKSTSHDGYFKTGDIGTMDARGFIRIVDRKKDMILVSGFNVFPNEIEGVVSNLEGVAESAAIGIPDERTGEAVRLFVVRRDPALSIETLQSHCRSNLAAYKVPKHIDFVDALPKSTVGKVLRRELRA